MCSAIYSVAVSVPVEVDVEVLSLSLGDVVDGGVGVVALVPLALDDVLGVVLLVL